MVLSLLFPFTELQPEANSNSSRQPIPHKSVGKITVQKKLKQNATNSINSVCKLTFSNVLLLPKRTPPEGLCGKSSRGKLYACRLSMGEQEKEQNPLTSPPNPQGQQVPKQNGNYISSSCALCVAFWKHPPDYNTTMTLGFRKHLLLKNEASLDLPIQSHMSHMNTSNSYNTTHD